MAVAIQRACDNPSGPARFVSPLSPDVFYAAMQALDVNPLRAIRDPVPAMRSAATADEEHLRRFIRLVLRGDVPALSDEEALRLYVAAVLAELLRKARRMRHAAPGRC